MKIYNRLKHALRIASVLLGVFSVSKMNAQVSAYSFTQTAGSYSTLTGSTALGVATGNASTANLNSGVYPVNLPFSFPFNGSSYSTVNVFDNGFITLGNTVPSGGTALPISSSLAFDGAISVFGRDLTSFFDITGVTGEVRYEITGTAPNREAVIEWKNFRPNYSISTTVVYSFSFQIRLEETTGVIKMVYDGGSYLVGSTSVSGSAQIGLRGYSTADFNSRTNSSSTLFLNSTASTAESGAQFYSTVNPTPGMPAAGTTYTWTPPACITPSGFTAGVITSNSAELTWNTPIPSPAGYDIYFSTTNSTPTSGTQPNIQNFVGNSTTIQSLNPQTRYYVWIRSNCGGSTGLWSIAPVSLTTKCQPLSIVSTTGATACNNTAQLTATADSGADITWYDAPVGGNVVGAGPIFTTPVINSTTDYWVSASTGTGNMMTGKAAYSASPSSGAGTTNFGLLFNALNVFTLEQVTLYPVSAAGAVGTVTIDLIDSSGNVLNSKTVNVTGAPTSSPLANVVDLNFVVFPGTNYKLRLGGITGVTGLLFDPTANAVSGSQGYPFGIANVLSITSSTLTANNTPRLDLYYYFYNWKTSTKCESARTMVTVTAGTGCLSTAETKKENAVQVYPNPFTEVLNIKNIEDVAVITIIDATGKILKKITNPSPSLNLSDLTDGLYLVKAQLRNGNFKTFKIIKK